VDTPLILLLLSALSQPQDAASEDFFERRIRPVLIDRCYECHSASSKKLKGGLRLDTPEGLLRVAPPRDLDRSPLLRAVRWADEELRMPPKEKLPAAAVADLEAWIRRGSLIPAPRGAPAGSGRHWSFVPPAETPVPQVRAREWVRTPVDAFILAKLEEKGLSPSPVADPRTLLRRLTYDLTGLPPTAEEIEAFDGSEEAVERTVDRLLASPRYGERWARHWMDVARYADTTDGGADARMAHAGPYREWVIRQLNEDAPYDRFVKEQLAADLVPGGRPEALGFLTLGRRFGDNIHDIIDDRLDVIGRGLLGLSISCARCHDHKFDPIPTADYYSLYGVLAASKEKAVPLGTPTPAHREELRRRNQELRAFVRDRGAEVQAEVRSRVKDYWTALAGETPEGIDPLVLAQWRSYLAKAKTSPLFELWHALSAIKPAEYEAKLRELAGRIDPRVAAAFTPPPASLREAAAIYGRLLETGELKEVLHGPQALPVLRVDPGSVGEEFFRGFTAGYEISHLKSKIARWETVGTGAAPRAMGLEDTVPKADPRIFKRGSPSSPGESVPRRFLAVLSKERRPFARGSGRLEMAEEIVRPDNPLTARVLVNRVWAHYFGVGIVATPSDFGTRSEPPSHPELLDWMARRFVADGWSLKKLHRTLVLSATYRQSSVDRPDARKSDPTNRLLWRRSPRRLDFEAMRDSLLVVSGGLDLSGGPSDVLTSQPYSRRRSVYGFVDRLNLSNVLMSFDVANPIVHTPQRHFTTVPQQALFLMNSPFLMEQSRRLVARPEISGTPAEKVRALYRRIYGRKPTETELAAGLRFVREVGTAGTTAPSAWSYGYGDGTTFHPLTHFTGEAWQSSPYFPDASVGSLMLDATGGSPGEDGNHAAIRRWTAPRDGVVSIRGTAKLLFDADTYHGSIRVKVVSSGLKTEKVVSSGEVPVEVEGLQVRQGETIDFVADWDGRASYDRFGWAPIVRMGDEVWSAEADFAGPAEAPLTPWEKYAQVLLETNEFLFND
jgi:hypothetical protein